MRQLYQSERRIIRNVGLLKWATEPDTSGNVVDEYYSSRTKVKRHFNTDFTLHLNDVDYSKFKFQSGVASILPNALGAEVFLTIDLSAHKPLILKLLGGEAYPPKYFRQFLDQLESMLSQLNEEFLAQHFPGVSVRDFLESVQPDKTQYSRVFVVGQDICFLFFPLDGQPTIRGDRCALVNTEEMQIDCFIEGSKITCIDGWMRTIIADSEYKLVVSVSKIPSMAGMRR